MEPLDQLRTQRGEIPPKKVILKNGKSQVSFTPFDLREDKASRARWIEKSAKVRLEDLASVRKGGLLGIAQLTGPLFGASLEEPVADWASAVAAAFVATRIQEVVNGKPLALLRSRKKGGMRDDESEAESVSVEKSIIRIGHSQECSIYTLSFQFPTEDGPYLNSLPALPWFQRYVREGAYEYAIVTEEPGISEDVKRVITVTLFSFKREISLADFLVVAEAACGVVMHPDWLPENVFVPEKSELSRTGKGVVSKKEVNLAEQDIPALGRLVQVIASLHLQGVRIDVFRSLEDDDFLSFDTKLAQLWYRFAKNLDRVKIGYCQQCGRPFSLAGHRGIPRRFCSEVCKTQAKNNRSKETRDNVRKSFLEGKSVEETARKAYPSLSAHLGEARVRRELQSWVELKHLAKEAKRSGNRPFLERLKSEGLDF